MSQKIEDIIFMLVVFPLLYHVAWMVFDACGFTKWKESLCNLVYGEKK
jgi:hypothetical protein